MNKIFKLLPATCISISLFFWSCEEDLPQDCAGVEGGSALVDSCGTCDDDPSNDCIEDCAGVFGGSALVDSCGTCDDDPSNDCIEDCAGVFGGNNICGCSDSTAMNYDMLVTFDDGSCAYDNESPIVQLTSDFSSDAVSDTIIVTAMATDNYGVERCELWIDGSFTGLTSNVEPYTFSYDTRLLSNGSHILVIRAYDFSGNIGDSPSAPMLTSNDFDAPEISIGYSADPGSWSGEVEIIFEVYDQTGIDSVLLYVDGILSDKIYSYGPYSFDMNTKNYDNGEHYVYGIAYDPYGYSAISDTIIKNFYNTPEMYLETTNSVVSVGDMFSANIVVERFPPVFAMTMQVSYNDSLFTVNESTGFESGDFFGSNSIEFYNVGSSRVYITKSLVQGDTPVSGFGTVGSINFSAEAVGQDTLKLEQIFFYDINGDEITNDGWDPTIDILNDLIISVE